MINIGNINALPDENALPEQLPNNDVAENPEEDEINVGIQNFDPLVFNGEGHWNWHMENLDLFVQDHDDDWGNNMNHELDNIEYLYINNILQHEPGPESLEAWLRITVVSCQDYGELENNYYNYQMSSQELVDSLIQDNQNCMIDFNNGLSNIKILTTAVRDLTDAESYLDVIEDYASGYSFYRAYREAHLI